ncbi:UDP-N-acetylglucosamine 4,6-dehydratase family protein [Acetivibrio clariflavus]|uniref:Putative nucleoside-diphosphate sugar epimerase n=1 Tax=Acetivibrio clariflavus (strain DSM 19732 / NBRC 101661 / EBR45) TaxID=720554 RepID=G8LTL2_ACECE|nr:UDP-N-acetylglucosamine 4,6-dehydratase family protein [Acetivibrio clariflavus]AEV70522.1 putative nucleoside-diphosphate sugar epimerase [Acetivibrio clariflavus DSM 19732]
MFKNKKVLVIGGTGTIGQALVERILLEEPSVVRIYSRDEYKQFLLKEKLGELKNIRFLLGDVRDKERLNRAMNDIDVVFNFAAMKHVPACEYDPFEAVKTNVLGTQNVIACAIENKVKKVIYSSSDKAVSPTNTMGATKLLAERLMSSAYYSRGNVDTIFASVRFGNVMGSRGSVIPLFKQQILDKGYITITEPEMTRFMMSLSQAVELTIKACKIAKGGEVFVLKMPVIRLKDLAEVIIDDVCDKNRLNKNKVEVKKIGLRPGEKMYEELMSEDESTKAFELNDMFIINPPYNEHIYPESKGIAKGNYSSKNEKVLSKAEIKRILEMEKLL